MSQYRIWHGKKESGKLYYVGQKFYDDFYDDVTEEYESLEELQFIMKVEFGFFEDDSNIERKFDGKIQNIGSRE